MVLRVDMADISTIAGMRGAMHRSGFRNWINYATRLASKGEARYILLCDDRLAVFSPSGDGKATKRIYAPGEYIIEKNPENRDILTAH